PQISGPHTGRYGTTYHLGTRSYTALLPVRQRWYDDRLAGLCKVVPADLAVTPVIALHWYLGDGHLAVDRRPSKAGAKPRIRLSTDGFRPEDVERLAAQLTQFRARIGRFGNGLRIVLDSAPFLDRIGLCPIPEVYGYKWEP